MVLVLKWNVKRISVSYNGVYISSSHIAPKVMMDAGSPCPSLSSLHSSNASPLTRQLSLPIESSTPLGNSVVRSLFPAKSTLERGAVELWEFRNPACSPFWPYPPLFPLHYRYKSKKNAKNKSECSVPKSPEFSCNDQIRGLQFEGRKMQWFKCEPWKHGQNVPLLHVLMFIV